MKLTRTLIVVLPLVVIAMLLEVRYYFDSVATICNFSDASKKMDEIQPVDFLKDMIEKLVQQRNNLSKTLNLKQQKLGQKECEEATMQKISSTGGWCAQESIESSGKHKTDTKLVPVLAQFLKGKYVASFGDGPGRYKQLLTEYDILKGYDAYDGAPFSEKTSEGRVMYLDLTLPQYGLPLYDWIISLEVAEHIPKEYESIYLDNIVRHAKEGVILSWAKPGQGGFAHVNARPFEYVTDALEKHGFKHDAEQSKMLKNSASLKWFQRNINVYKREYISETDNIKNISI